MRKTMKASRIASRSSPARLASISLLVLLVSGLPPLAARAADNEAVLPAPVQPYPVRDVVTEQTRSFLSPIPDVEFVNVGDVVVFKAWDGIHGWELWRTDGTKEGTRLLKDICVGDCSSFPTELRALLGHVYFFAVDGEDVQTIWRTDGTTTGTRKVAAIGGGWGQINTRPIRFLTEFQGSLYFVNRDLEHGEEIWRSGAEPGSTAEIFVDLAPGRDNAGPASLFVVGDTMFFTAVALAPSTLWKTDGTATGTVPVKDLGPGEWRLWQEGWAFASGSWIFSQFDGRLVFITVKDGPYWDRVWTSDGTAEGTVQLSELQVGGTLFPFRAPDGAVLFPVGDGFDNTALGRTDGTPDGTYVVKELEEGRLSSLYGVIGATAEFVLFRVIRPDGAIELWRTDGTEAGTHPIRQVGDVSGGFFTLALTTVPHLSERFVYFEADDGNGLMLWRTDGTTIGTIPLAAANLGNTLAFSFGGFSWSTELDGRLIFYNLNDRFRWELWKSDGSSVGTSLLHPIDRQASALDRPFVNFGSSIYLPEIAAGESGVLFGVHHDLTGQLWRSDGTPGGTRRIPAPSADDCVDEYFNPPRGLTTVGSEVALIACGEESLGQLWFSDGTVGATRQIDVGGWLALPHWMTSWDSPDGGSRLATTSFVELWISDGNDDGTVPVIPEIFLEGEIREPTPVGEHLFFATGERNRAGLWMTDGEFRDAVELYDFPDTDLGSSPNGLIEFGPGIVFTADDGLSGREPWISDGTMAGTRILKDIRVGPDSSSSLQFFGGFTGATASRAFFPADDGATGTELWATDGTTAGTYQVADLNLGPGSSNPRPWIVCGRALFLSAWDPIHGRELWMTDGTAAGTRMVIDLHPGPESGVSDRLIHGWRYPFPRQPPIIWNNRLYFAGSDGTSGFELWSTDGSAAGTVQVADINPGPGASSPAGFTVWEDRLFFSATDGETGYELWALGEPPPPETIFADGFETGGVAAWSGESP